MKNKTRKIASQVFLEKYQITLKHKKLDNHQIAGRTKCMSMTKNKIYQSLKVLGKMPEQDFENSSVTMEKIANQYRVLLEMIVEPITINEAKFLISILPEKHFYDLEWSILSLVESIELQDKNDELAYEELIKCCVNEEIKSNLLAGYENWKESHQ